MQVSVPLLKEPVNSYGTVNATGNEYGDFHELYFFEFFLLILVKTADQEDGNEIVK